MLNCNQGIRNTWKEMTEHWHIMLLILMYILSTTFSRASLSKSCSTRLYFLPRGPWCEEGGGICALQCGLLVNYGSRAAARLAWAGVGASGSGTGRSGHRPRRWRHEVWDESEHQPGVWSIPRIPSSHGCLPVYQTRSKERICSEDAMCE